MRSGLEVLRQPPQRFGPTELTRHLERLDAIHALGLAPETAPAVPAAVIDRLAAQAHAECARPRLARLPEAAAHGDCWPRCSMLSKALPSMTRSISSTSSSSRAYATPSAATTPADCAPCAISTPPRSSPRGRPGVVVAEAASEAGQAARAGRAPRGDLDRGDPRGHRAHRAVGASSGRPPLRRTLRPLATPSAGCSPSCSHA